VEPGLPGNKRKGEKEMNDGKREGEKGGD